MRAMAAFTALDQSSTWRSSGSLLSRTATINSGLARLGALCVHSRSRDRRGTAAVARRTSGRSRNRSITLSSAWNRFAPRHCEYRLTNSAASRTYFEIGCSAKWRTISGMKHSLCFNSMLGKAQPSESRPTK